MLRDVPKPNPGDPEQRAWLTSLFKRAVQDAAERGADPELRAGFVAGWLLAYTDLSEADVDRFVEWLVRGGHGAAKKVH